MWSVVWSSLAAPVKLALLASTLGGANLCAVSGLFPGVVVENSVEHFSRGSDFLPTTPCSAFDGPSRKSKLFGSEGLAFVWNPLLNPPLPRTSPDRLRDTIGGCAFNPASSLLVCWFRPSHWEIFSLMLIPCLWEGGLPNWQPSQAIVAPFFRPSTSPPPRLSCSSLRASMLWGGKLTLSSPLVNAWGFFSKRWEKRNVTKSVVNPEMMSKNSSFNCFLYVFRHLLMLKESHFPLWLLL